MHLFSFSFRIFADNMQISEITVFKGIPYTAPPVGELRWKRPQPVVGYYLIKRVFLHRIGGA